MGRPAKNQDAEVTATQDNNQQPQDASAEVKPKKSFDAEKFKNLINYGKRDRWAVPKMIKQAYPEMDFKYFVEDISRVTVAEGDGWEIANVPAELAEKLKKLRKSEQLYGSLSGDTWKVGGQILMMRPKEEVVAIRAMKEVQYKKLEGKDLARQQRTEISRAVPEYEAAVPVEIETKKE